jgi:pteridine reductase
MTTRRVALVTGSGKRRIGRFIADALAERGWALAIHYRNSRDDAEEALAEYTGRGIEALALRADLTSDREARELVQATVHHLGRIDVLVNCASLYPKKPLEDVSADEVRASFEVNVLGTFLCAKNAGLLMVGQAEGGLIVNFGDWAEARPYPNYAAYFASKGAIPALTRSLAVELGTRNPNVRVNCILPGPVLFPPSMPEAEKREAVQATLVKHAGSPEHIARAVIYLVDNDFVTGSCLTVDGGRTIYAGGR